MYNYIYIHDCIHVLDLFRYTIKFKIKILIVYSNVKIFLSIFFFLSYYSYVKFNFTYIFKNLFPQVTEISSSRLIRNY